MWFIRIYVFEFFMYELIQNYSKLNNCPNLDCIFLLKFRQGCSSRYTLFYSIGNDYFFMIFQRTVPYEKKKKD